MSDWLAVNVMDLVSLLLNAGAGFAALFIGLRVADRKGTAKGWTAGILALLILGMAVAPAVSAISKARCGIKWEPGVCD